MTGPYLSESKKLTSSRGPTTSSPFLGEVGRLRLTFSLDLLFYVLCGGKSVVGGALVCNLAVTGMGVQPGSDLLMLGVLSGRRESPTESSTYCFCSVLCGVVSVVVSKSSMQPGSDLPVLQTSLGARE